MTEHSVWLTSHLAHLLLLDMVGQGTPFGCRPGLPWGRRHHAVDEHYFWYASSIALRIFSH